MFTQTKFTKLFTIITLLVGCVFGVYAQEKGEVGDEEAAVAVAPIRFYDPPRLFTIPVGYTPRSLDINGSGSAIFGTDVFQFLGTGLIGLGDIAQFEGGTLGILSMAKGEKSKLSNLPIVGIKFCFPGENIEQIGTYLPTISAAFRRSFGGEDERPDVTYKKQLADLYIVASKSFKYGNWRGVTAHAGIDFHSAKLTTTYRDGSEEMVSLGKITNLLDGEELGSIELKEESPIVPFAGLEIWAAPRAKLMFEFLYTAVFKEDTVENERKAVIEKWKAGETETAKSAATAWLKAIEGQKRVEREWMTTFGVRFFFTQYVATDIGIRYQGNFESVADANIETKLAVSFPTHLIYDYVVSR
ncbi:hypothetical protein FJZ31_18700 [Candidatus Poribacteria bacterium]|nr:hypothetical protein [Candidatus Poribacteria bacterium]